jgi:hypothetical protein
VVNEIGICKKCGFEGMFNRISNGWFDIDGNSCFIASHCENCKTDRPEIILKRKK